MKIGFDAKRFFNNFTGLGNYSRFLIHALSEYAADNEYFLYSPKVKSHPEFELTLRRNNIHVITPPTAYRFFGASSLWRTWGISKEPSTKTLNVFHGLSQELPAGLSSSIKKVVTVHDLIFIRFPDLYKPVDAAIYKAKVQSACRRADRIVAISHQTKQDIVEFLKIDSKKIDVIYQGCHPSFKRKISVSEVAATKAKYALPDNYILNVGTIEARKNVLLIVKALSLLPDELKLHVLIIGRPTDYKAKVVEQAERLGVRRWILFLHDISFADLPAIYQGARVFVYPSIFEGFGIPIVEALESSVPVIAATGSCLQEAGGEGSIYISPESGQELAEQLVNVLSDDTLRTSMITAGRSHLENFDPATIASKIMAVYKNS